MHGDNTTLGGPVWLFAQFVILGSVVLALFVFIDSLRPSRRAASRAPEPLWLYTVLTAAFLGLLVIVQYVPGLNLASAVVSVSSPFALALGVAYLLRVVFPKPDPENDGGEGL